MSWSRMSKLSRNIVFYIHVEYKFVPYNNSVLATNQKLNQ